MSRGKRMFDLLIAVTGLVVSTPLLVIAAVGIRLSSPGPIFYRARRIARDRRRPGHEAVARLPERRRSTSPVREFTIYKLRTMRIESPATASSITAHDDARVFPFGAWLRRLKIDELPQLFNVIKADMAIVGPRPEAPEIVRGYFTPEDLETLRVPPGITSPGSLHYYTHCEQLLTTAGANNLHFYVEKLLPLKLSLDRVYIGRATLAYDVRMVVRTVAFIVGRALGKKHFPDPPELAEVAVSQLSSFSTKEPVRRRTIDSGTVG